MKFANRKSVFCFFVVGICQIRGALGGTEVKFSKCGTNGFSCMANANKKIDITYECKINDAIIYINLFSAPSNINSLLIKNCQSLSVSTRCSGERKFMQKLQIINVQQLRFLAIGEGEAMLPSTVIIENVTRIAAIYEKVFSQKTSNYPSKCFSSPHDFESIYLSNVSIDGFHSRAFVAPKLFKNFSLINVNIKRIATSGINLKQDLQASFEMRGCNVDIIEYMGIKVYGRRVMLTDNSFQDILPSGINGTMEDFYFTKNSVQTLHPYGFSILATNIFILDNSFLYLKGSALEKLSPGLPHNSDRNFGTLKFVYDFSKNSLSFLDAGSLHPDFIAYENVQTEMMFSRNTFLCTCEGVGWLFSSLSYSPNMPQMEPFYEMVLDETYKNVCERLGEGQSCNLPVKIVNKTIEAGRCRNNVSIEDFCVKVATTLDYVTEAIAEEMVVAENDTFISGAEKWMCQYLNLVCMLLTIFFSM